MRGVMKKYFTLLLIILLSTLIYGQEKGTLRGTVVDSLTGEVLPFCNVQLKSENIGASTDSKGLFFIPYIRANRLYNLVVTYVGYESRTTKVFIAPNKITDVKILLKPKSIEMQAVEKIGNRIAEKNATDLGLQRITIKELEALPKGVEPDIFRALQYMPGVRSTGDVSAKYYVRGGASNQNLVLLDGVTIYNPYHAMGLFSSIDQDIVNSVEFYKGGFSSEYGGRLSSVLKVETKDGNRNNFSGKAAGSYLTAKAMIEGPTPIGSFFLSGRKSHSSSILKKFLNDKNAPVSFYDLHFKTNFALPDVVENARFSVSGMLSSDKLFNEDQTKEDYKWKNNFANFRWTQLGLDSPIFYDLNLSYSDYVSEVIPNFSGIRYQKNTIKDLSINAEVTYVYESKNELKIGLQIKDLQFDYESETIQKTKSLITSNGASIVLFSKFRLLEMEDLGIDGGLRWNLTRLATGTTGQKFLEPRLSLTYRFIPQMAFKFAAGLYNQEFITIADENAVLNLFEAWVVTPNYLKPSEAIHLIAGLDYDLNEEIKLEVESYYKKIEHFSVVNEEKYTILDNDLKDASGEAYGLDFMMQYNSQDVSISGAYSLGWVFNTVDGVKYRPKFDARHSLNFGINYNLGAGWRAGLTWVFTSGRPFTQMVGFYDKIEAGTLTSDLALTDYYSYIILGEKNKGTLPDYHRMDFILSKKLNIMGVNSVLDFSIINLYNRANIFYYKRATGERVNMLPFLPSVNLKVEI